MCTVLYTLFYVVLHTGFYVAGIFHCFAGARQREHDVGAGLRQVMPIANHLLQINGLREAEGETAVDAEDNVCISIFLVGGRSRTGSPVSFLVDATLGEDARGLDHDR